MYDCTLDIWFFILDISLKILKRYICLKVDAFNSKELRCMHTSFSESVS